MTHHRFFVSRNFDLAFFHGPIWLVWVVLLLLPASLRDIDLPLSLWVGIVLLIDVGHVWSSLYRTYLDPVTRKAQPWPLALAPPLAFAACFVFALFGEQLFWRLLAYVAVFHFIKQQVGITALYAARYDQALSARADELQPLRQKLRRLDRIAIYTATLCPLLWWHAHLPRKFAWFVEGDFISMQSIMAIAPESLQQMGAGLFYIVWVGSLVTWLLFHVVNLRRRNLPMPLGKLLWVLGTALNWWLGLVYFNSDLAFTLTNVVAHGIPYYGLIALHQTRVRPTAHKHHRLKIALLLLPILILAANEEYLWDVMLYHEHDAFFANFLPYWRETLVSLPWRAFWIAILSLPQTVHYILDGFIWKMDGRNPDLRKALFPALNRETARAS